MYIYNKDESKLIFMNEVTISTGWFIKNNAFCKNKHTWLLMLNMH